MRLVRDWKGIEEIEEIGEIEEIEGIEGIEDIGEDWRNFFIFEKNIMENNEWINYKIEIRERLKSFSLKILEISEKIPETTRGRVINYQLTKSGTSLYANYRAALRARSKAEFFSKLCISVEEADETEMWLELLIESKIHDTKDVIKLQAEILDILKTLSSMRKKLSP